MIGRSEFTGATADMTHPYGYSFLVSFVICVFAGFVVSVLTQDFFNGREGVLFTLGFLTGGFAFAWLMGAFSTEYGLAAAFGYFVGLAGMGYLLLRGGSKNA